MTAALVVDAALIGVPRDEFLGYTVRQRASIVREYNARVKGK